MSKTNMDFKDYFTGEVSPPAASPLERLRRDIAQANASWALEGIEPSQTELLVQEKLASGEITLEEARSLLLSEFRRDA